MPIFLRTFAISMLLLTAIADASPPNVILILADDMAIGDLSCMNGGASRTPHLDRLRAESIWFNRAYSASPVCAPARAALLTGRYPHRTGVVTLNMHKHPDLTRLKLDETTLADLFKGSGYATGIIGKWHLGVGGQWHPLSRGFDEFVGFISHLDVPSYFQFELWRQREKRSYDGRYLTDHLTEAAIDFVKRHHRKPFFLHLAHYAPHRPLEAPANVIQPYLDSGLDEETATVYAMVEIMDRGIGELLAELKRLRIDEQTIVIFASDNGPDPLVAPRENVSLRGTKYTVYEGGIRVPLMWRWPTHWSASERNEIVHFTDVVPTLIELCGLSRDSELMLDGISFLPSLEGREVNALQKRFWQWNRGTPDYSHNAAVLADGRWKLVRPFVTKNYPRGPSRRDAMLYDVLSDPSEMDDVAVDHPAQVENLSRALDEWTIRIEQDRQRVEK